MLQNTVAEDRELCDLLVRHAWAYGLDSDAPRWGRICFFMDGRTDEYKHPNERRWSVEGGTLTLRTEDGRPSGHFALDAAGARPALIGRPVENPHLRYRLDAIDPLAGVDVSRRHLLVESRVHAPDGPLLVVFNSVGFSCDESGGVRWEYYRSTDGLGLDTLRFAEQARPCFFYLNKIDEIHAWLRFAAGGRRHVVLAGNSSGGYAAMRFGEFVAASWPGCRVETIAFNPVVAFAPERRAHLSNTVASPMLAPTIEHEVFASLPHGRATDLDLLLDRSLANVRHTLVFDSGNPADAYHAGLLRGFPQVEQRPCSLGMRHGHGIERMQQLGIMAEILQERLPAGWTRSKQG